MPELKSLKIEQAICAFADAPTGSLGVTQHGYLVVKGFQEIIYLSDKEAIAWDEVHSTAYDIRLLPKGTKIEIEV